jgi:hypothetical protein
MTFAQGGQRVDNQANIDKFYGTLNIGRAKISPRIERFQFRIDRTPQCVALREAVLSRLSDPQRSAQPICAIACGAEDDLPNILANSLLDHVEVKVLGIRNMRGFAPPRKPICRSWPDPGDDTTHLWQTIGTVFLDLPALSAAQDVRTALGQRPESIAFGFEVNVSSWSRRAATLEKWIDEFQACRGPQQGIALAVISAYGPSVQRESLAAFHAEIERRYDSHPSVVVLPMLGPVDYAEFRAWQTDLIAELGDDANEGDLATLSTRLFPDETVPRRLGHIWPELSRIIRAAWNGP